MTDEERDKEGMDNLKGDLTMRVNREDEQHYVRSFPKYITNNSMHKYT